MYVYGVYIDYATRTTAYTETHTRRKENRHTQYNGNTEKIDLHNAYTRGTYENFPKKIAIHNAMTTTHNGSRTNNELAYYNRL